MSLAVKNKNGRKITVTDKGHHLDEWKFHKKKGEKFNHLESMVVKRAGEKIIPYLKKRLKLRTKVSPNRKKLCWEVHHPELSNGCPLFRIVLNYNLDLDRWVFSVFSLEKGCWKDSKDLKGDSLCLAIEDHFLL